MLLLVEVNILRLLLLTASCIVVMAVGHEVVATHAEVYQTLLVLLTDVLLARMIRRHVFF